MTGIRDGVSLGVTRRATKKVVILLILFALFIFLCGAGHLLRCIEMADTPLFRAVNILTAVISITTSIYLMPFVPNLLEGTDKLYLEATASKQIIAKMYPPHIRERLLHHERSKLDGSGRRRRRRRRRGTIEEVEMNKESCKISKSHDAIRQRIQEFIRRHSSKADALEVVHSQEGVENVLLDSVPIADGFKDTSIMFADISSFTYWSSQHSPIEVFTLLESLFFEFDRIANDMGVYKLSTVGDCYIASAGVPYPRKDHAIELTQFAERCRLKANELLVRLNPKLDTDNLGIRIGIHSGPVTAGVLRGDTPRFDLFGDTINTAERIESTGKPNCIHLSEQTAQLIEQAGMGDWLIPRKDAVKAKGKGELKTYWLRGAEDVDPQDMV
jgi:class 3 adenylate cyclase